VTGKCGIGTLLDIRDAITWSAGLPVAGVPDNPNPARVINMSVGVADSCLSGTQSIVDNAYKRRTVLVAAAGNASHSTVDTPASCNHVIAVAA